jgi:two-component system LytT family response regulator
LIAANRIAIYDGFVMKILIVDPDVETRTVIRAALSRERLHLVDECAGGLEAVLVVRETTPDLVFCEVDLPGISGFSLMEMLPPGKKPLAAFLSRSEHHAARAFEASAFDYLLKPLRPERVRQTLERALRRLGAGASRPPGRPMDSGRITIRTGRSVLFLQKSELDWAEADGKNVRLHLGRESLLLRMSISSLENEMDPAQFLRIHRSVLVNVDRVRWVQPCSNGRNYQLVLHDGTRLTLSRKDHLPAITGRAALSV